VTRLHALLTDLTCGDDPRAEAAACRIGEMGAAALPALLELTQPHQPPHARWWGLRALAGVHAPETGSHLKNFLQDEDPALRECAALGLVHHPEETAIPALTACLADPNRLLARLAADALIAIGSPAVPALIDLMQKGAAPERLEAARALAKIGDPRATPPLLKAIQDGDTSLIEFWADAGLDALGVGMAFFKP
jgi:hypothetical protein